MRILIIKLTSIGDVIHTLPAVAFLRRALPQAHLTWVVDRRASAIIKESPAIDEIIELDTRAWQRDFSAGATISDIRAQLKNLRSVPALNGSGTSEIAIDFQGLLKSGLVAFASRAKTRIGFETPELREPASKLLLTNQVRTTEFGHVISKNLALAHAAITFAGRGPSQKTISVGEYEFPIAVSNEDHRLVDSMLDKQHLPFAIINPGGGWTTKLLSTDRFAQLADWLWSDCGLSSLITFGPGEENLARAVADNSRSGSARPIASTLKQFVALAKRATLFIGCDTGPLHIAAACGTPVVGLYGPTSPERNGPFDSRDIAVGRDLWCRANCHRRSCWHWECMEIPIDEIKEAVTKRLAIAKEGVSV